MTQASGNARWAELVQTLNELNKTYHDVCELGRKKHKALIVIDLKSIEAMNSEEARLTQAIESGTYHVDAKDIAAKMLGPMM